MKPIREQLREQAERTREWWAMTPGVAGRPRVGAILLEVESPVLPTMAIHTFLGRVNSGATYAPEGCLLFRGAITERAADGVTGGRRTRVHLEYRERPWGHHVLVTATTSLAGGKPKILVDPRGTPPYPAADFDEWLDALEPPCGRAPGASDDGPPSGSWRDRPALL